MAVLKLTSTLIYVVVLLVSLVAIAASSRYYYYYSKGSKIGEKFTFFYTRTSRV